MDSLLIVAQQVAILFVLMGFGAVMRRMDFFRDGSIDGVVNILLLVVTPCLVVDVFQRPFDPTALKNFGVAFLIAAFGHLAMIVCAYLCVRHVEARVRNPLRLAAVFSNAGFMGLPLEQAILGPDGVRFGIVYVVVFNLFIWSWGLATMRGSSASGIRLPTLHAKMWINPGTVGLALALPLFFGSVKLPAIIGVPIHEMAGLNTPLAMVTVGYYLAGAKLGAVARIPSVWVATFIRLVLCPLVVIAVLMPFRQTLDRNMMLAMVIAASAPVAAMVSMFAVKYDCDVDVSVGIMSGSTILSIVTMPPVTAFAMSVL